MSNLDGNQENLFGNNSDNNFYIDNERKIAIDESSSDNDTVYSWYDYELGDNLENLTLLDSFYDEDDYLVPIELDNHIIYGHPSMYRLDKVQGNSNYLNKNNDTVGTDCGIVAVKNILILANKINEEPENQLQAVFYKPKSEINEAYFYYMENGEEKIVAGGFDTTEKDLLDTAISCNFADNLGTTNDLGRILLLAKYGIVAYSKLASDSDFYQVVAENVKKGHGVIINTDSHSMAITGVVYNSNGNIAGFYLTDSAGGHNDYEYCPLSYFYNINVVSANITTNKIIQNREQDSINGTGNSLDNKIEGTSGDNILKGESGNDEIYGLSGNDILIGDSSTLTVQELEDLRYSEQEVNIVYFESENDGNDYLNGGEGEDLLIGGGGNDIRIGGEDKDTLYGGSGNDLLIAGDTSKTQEELQNIINNNASFSVADFEADNSKNTLYGGIGNDLIIGDKGKDTIYGGNDDDIIYGGKGNDTIYGDDSNNVYTGNDVLVGGEGNDTLYGGNGNDVIIAGNTSLSVDSLKNLSAIKNSIEASAYQSQNGGENKLYGGNGNDLLIGDKGNDTLKGGSGDDYLYGGKGDDKLIGGTGNNYLYGGKGNDEYRLTAGSKNTIKDTDNVGSVYKGSQQLTGAGKDDYKGNNVWIKNGVKYKWNEGSHILLINGGLATIKDFKNGALGITLEKPEDEPEPPEKADNDMTEPIVLDLDGNGFGTTNVSNGVYFDFNNDGFAEKIAWADDGDGVLVADLNNNGKIDNGTEVLTAETLSSFDTNNDGVINSEDENFANLKIMQNNGTVLSLTDAGVESINTNITETDYTDENENFLFGEGSFTKTDGTINNFGEYYFKTDYTDTEEVDLIEETEAVTALPDIENVGKLRSLHQAMLRDENLQTLVSNFVSETNDTTRMEILEQMIFKWAGCENIEINSRGFYVNAKNLALWETINGKDFISSNEGEDNPSFPNEEAASLIETEIAKFKNNIYAQLMQQTHLKTYYDAIDKTEIQYDLTPVINLLDAQISQNEAVGKDLVYQVAKMLKGLDLIDSSNFFDAKNDNCFYLKYTTNDRNLKWLIDSIGEVYALDITGEGEGTSGDDSFMTEEDEDGHFHSLWGNDVLYGNNDFDSFYSCAGNDIVDGGDGDDEIFAGEGNDIVFGGAGNDQLYGAWGDDTIFGGDGDDTIYPDQVDNVSGYGAGEGNDIIRGDKGNDTIYSDLGDDTFIFNLGDGQDTVYEKQGVDTFYFGNGISWSDLTFEQSGDDMVIKINNTTDQITVKDWFLTTGENYKYDNNKIEIFEFADGSKHYKDEITVGDNTDAITCASVS